MRKIITIMFFLLHLFTSAHQSKKLELTKEDICSTGKLDGINVSVFGVYLGISKAEAKKILFNNPTINVVLDKYSTTSKADDDSKALGYFIYNVDSVTKKSNNCLCKLNWFDEELGLGQINIFTNMQPFTFGLTQKLFTSDAVNEESIIRRKLLPTPTEHYSSYGRDIYWFAENKIKLANSKDKYGNTVYYFLLDAKDHD